MAKTLIISGQTYTNVTGFKATDSNDTVQTYIQPEGSTTIISNGTVDVTEFASAIINVPVGSTINNQNKTATPSQSTQVIAPDTGYTGLDQVTINPIPSEYVTTADADAVAANILLNKTAYVDGSKITGTMPNNGATGGTITTQSGTYTIPAGYTTGGTVTANLVASPVSNAIINGAAELEDTNDYAFEVEVNIPEGYHEATTLTKSFSSILPAPDTAIAENQMLAGYQAYNGDGQLLTGSMVNNGTWSRTLDQTTTSVTIPAGYHSGSGTVSHATVNIPDPTITVSAGGLITASGSWTRGFTTDNSYSKTSQLTPQAAKTVTPTESEQTAVAAGVYTTGIVKVGAISSTYVGSGIAQNDSDDLTVSGATVTVPAGYYANNMSKSVATGSATPQASISSTNATVNAGTNTLTLTRSMVLTPQVTEGYIVSGTAVTRTVSLTASVTTKAAATITPTTTNQTIASGTYLTGTQTIAGDADLIAANIKSGVQIFGVTGTYAGLDTSDATATAADIVSGKTAYVDGREVEGSLVVQHYYTDSTAPSSSLGNNGDIYLQS